MGIEGGVGCDGGMRGKVAKTRRVGRRWEWVAESAGERRERMVDADGGKYTAADLAYGMIEVKITGVPCKWVVCISKRKA